MKRSFEILCHFQCGKCQKWWSIGDAPKEKTAWFCPWCGEWNREDKEDKQESKLSK